MDGKSQIINDHKDLIRGLYEYVKECLQFTEDCKISFLENKKNASDPLGRTAYYDPQNKKVSVYITGRHIKDVLRSLSHELVHHAQNCRGEFKGQTTTEGYAQENDHLREMEREAYEMGNMMFRDYEDKLKGGRK